MHGSGIRRWAIREPRHGHRDDAGRQVTDYRPVPLLRRRIGDPHREVHRTATTPTRPGPSIPVGVPSPGPSCHQHRQRAVGTSRSPTTSRRHPAFHRRRHEWRRHARPGRDVDLHGHRARDRASTWNVGRSPAPDLLENRRTDTDLSHYFGLSPDSPPPTATPTPPTHDAAAAGHVDRPRRQVLGRRHRFHDDLRRLDGTAAVRRLGRRRLERRPSQLRLPRRDAPPGSGRYEYKPNFTATINCGQGRRPYTDTALA